MESHRPDIGLKVLLDALRVSQRLNCCFQFLGRPKSDFLAGLDLNRLAGRRIAPHASGSFSYLQDAKPGNSYSFALLQMLGDQSDKVVEEFAPRPFCQLVLLAKLTATWLSVIVTWSAIFFPRDAHGPHPAGAVDEEGTRPHHRSRYGHVGPATLCQSATLLGPPCTGLR